MVHWIFKVSNQELYPDEQGKRYVYDNIHSVQVTAGDCFIYLDKRGGLYAFTGHGTVQSITSKSPSSVELRRLRVNRGFTANLGDLIQYSQPVAATISGRHKD